MAAARAEPSFTGPVVASLAFHALVIAAFLSMRAAAPPPMPPVYRVSMVAAPPGPRQVGTVQPAPAAPTAEAPPPTRPNVQPTTPVPVKRPVSTRPQTRATPLPPTTTPASAKPQAAGGGATGGSGTDVATINTSGIEFPYPDYLRSIVRAVARYFTPSNAGALHAEVAFLIRRDGTVPLNSIRLVQRSGVYSFDLEAQGAVEAAANNHAFQPLPGAFADDVLPVIFRFDPRVLR